MTIHEYGKSNAKTVVLVHPSVVMWDFFEYLIPLLEKDCHVIIPALRDMMKMIHSKILPAWKISPGNWQSG